MAFMDKLKDAKNKALETANSVAQSAKDTAEKAKENYEQKKAEEAAKRQEMERKTNEYSKKLVNEIMEYSDGSKGGFYNSVTEDDIKKFTKDFYEKLLLPGSKTSTSCVSMHPYIDAKRVKEFGKTFTEYSENELPVIFIKDNDGQMILLTLKNMYFKISVPDAKGYFAKGCVACSNIDLFALEPKEDKYVFKCDTYELLEIKLINAYKQDFISLNEYFICIKEKDFEITNEEIDKLIHEKIGSKIYDDIKKYMVYDDELVMYYAGGLDSLTATDYVACTTKQIIIVDREMFGATANVKQFYYEDVTSMATIQNANSGDLLVDLIDTALTSAFKLCDLEITVAGAKNKISTLTTVEAQRVISIYHEFRKLIKTQAATPQVIVQQNDQPDVLAQIEKLAKLKDAGILTEDEFTQKKSALLEKL